MSFDSTDQPSIQVTENGPYLVSGHLALSEQTIGLDDSGNAWTWVAGEDYEVADRYALCRCGHSSNKPFCDGTHAKVGFDGTETASRVPFEQQATVIEGPTMELHDAVVLCAFARFCDGFGSVWNTIERTDDGGARELSAYQGSHCPSGRLVVHDNQNGGRSAEPDVEPSVGLIEDPQQSASGPIWARGGITVIAADGKPYEQRNRVTLCRCGQSKNKPFCDGTHAHIGFRARPDSEVGPSRQSG